MPTDYRNTSLWTQSFECNGLTTEQRVARDKLALALDGLETHVKDLLAKIPEDCQGLTVHDIRHVHQLWDVASTICGSDYPMNPLEGFVLGAAFLIHDAGLTAAAYPGGVEALKQTQLYRDMFATELKERDPNLKFTNDHIVSATKEQKERVLFSLLRCMHAERALQLLDAEYIHPITQQRWTLAPAELLFDVGLPIGKIAASHHWDIRAVADEFRHPYSPPAAFPGWSIDGLKLACILRCADAAAIDERRAPIMAFILEHPRGISHKHWMFQSYLKPGYLRSGEEALVFESKRPFKRENMDAWWIAYEAIVLADRELRDCDRLLKQRAGQNGHDANIQLAAKRVEGASDVTTLPAVVTVQGWRPVETSVRISDPIAIVELFGGRRLYGNDHSAPLRELIQNSADGVRNRRLKKGYGPEAAEAAGQIQISIEHSEGDSWLIRVSDDGIGMPEEVLTGPFIEFGKSLWGSNILPRLYPGLASNPDFNPTGRFGIGFYASFIIGKNIKVMTKPDVGGENERRVLHFKNGVKGRAELRSHDVKLDHEWRHAQSTVVEIKCDSDNWLAEFASLSFHGYIESRIYSNERKFWDFFVLTLRRLVFCLDVQVILKCPYFDNVTINRTDIFQVSNEVFADEFNNTFGDSRNERIPLETVTLIDPVGEVNRSRTRGVISIDHASHGIYHIGGLTVLSDGATAVGARYVVGVSEAIPTTVARQSPKRLVSSEKLRDWAEKQFAGVQHAQLTSLQLSAALLNVHALGVDLKDKHFLHNIKGELIYFGSMDLHVDDSIFISCTKHHYMNKIEISQLQHVALLYSREFIEQSPKFKYVLELNWHMSGDDYATVELFGESFASQHRSAIAALFNEIRRRGFEPVLSDLGSQEIATYIGPDGPGTLFSNIQLKNGMTIHATGVVVTVGGGPTT